MTAALHIHQLNKHFANGKHALRDINLTVQRGEMVALIGASGSGKSTLLRHVAGLVVADASSDSLIEVDGRCVQQAGRIHSDIRKVRSQVGFVFQQFNLLARTSALENVELPLVYAGVKPAERQARARAALARVGLAERAAHTPAELSGGQQQRVAIARALVTQPALILADEPTGALDSQTSEDTMALLAQLNAQGITVVLVTHEHDVAAWARRCIVLRDGAIVQDQAQPGHAQQAATSAALPQGRA